MKAITLKRSIKSCFARLVLKMGKFQKLPGKIRRAFGLKRGRGYTRAYAEFLLTELSPGLGRDRMMARVVSVIPQSVDSKSFVIRPPARWRGFAAGMHLPVAVEVNGSWCYRTYTISSTPEEFRNTGTVTLTVRKLPDGKVSGWLFDHVAEGDWLQVNHAAGEFTLAGSDSDAPLLMLAAGIGITPLYSMLRDQAQKRPNRDVVMFYYVRGQSEAPFLGELQKLSHRMPGFTLVPVFTGGPSVEIASNDADSGRISHHQLQSLCPDLGQREILMCGPAGFMSAAREILLAGGIGSRQLHSESFGIRGDSVVVSSGPAEIIFSRSGKRHASEGTTGSLLDLAEQAGLKPKHGCRAGVCHQCKTTKFSGKVTDVRSGAVSGADREEIQLCVSVPSGTVELDL